MRGAHAVMSTIRCGLSILLLASPAAQASQAASTEAIYIEFLWAKTPVGALARQQTRQFVLEDGPVHQVCVAANAQDTDVQGLTLAIRDAAGTEVSRSTHADYRGRKQCFPAQLGHAGAPGQWTVDTWLGDGRHASATVRVDRTLDDSPYMRDPAIAYVYGRPNYDADIPPADWVGRVEWQMDVDPQGRVTHVAIVAAEGVGTRLRDRAIAAGYISLFPPDAARTQTPLRARRALSFAAE
ncbi:hypothetical protein [Stenotrophomonas sp. 364]|uniref:hypothetical protein n=1 Tax=Stenotrophomonas sp. 364 TaxID=2691571 RepID=UPI001F36B216|nr:hypothetical protein [Stenotrophomonas sp. 364]